MPLGDLKPVVGPSRQNLSRLFLIRSILVFAMLAASLWLFFSRQIVLPWLPVFSILLTMIIINTLLFFRLRKDWPVGEGEFFTNLLIDVLFLTLILYFTGGSTNPLVSYYLIPLIISAAVLRPLHTWLIACLSIAFYTLLLFYYQPLAIFTMSGHGHAAMSSAHIVGMWLNFGFSAVLISWFVVRMAATLRQQSVAIAQSRESGLRNEQIISVASIAAGTAHEMRTPLATMALTVEDIGSEHPALKEEMQVLQAQIKRCDDVLRELVSTSTVDSEMVVTDFRQVMENLCHKWSLARPESRLHTFIDEDVCPLKLRYDQSLLHALMSLLNNAADASPDYVAIKADSSGESIRIMIEDYGPGIPEEVADNLGKTYISRKQGGLGLGVLLSQASIERLGGKVSMHSKPGSGTRLEINLPLYKGVENEPH